MLKILPDGSVISSNMSTSERKDYFNLKSVKDFGTYKAVILEKYPIDHEKNRSKSAVEYKIRIVNSDKAGFEYTGARMWDSFGGVVNFSEITLQPKTNKLNPLVFNPDSAPPEDYDNTYVIIQFLGGYRVPIITSGWAHPGKTVPAAKEEDGVRLLKELNGIRWNINKDGELILTYLGGQRTPLPPLPGTFPLAENPHTAPTQIKIDKTGGLTIVDKELNEIKINREDKKISFTQYEGQLLNELKTDYDSGYKVNLLPTNFPINEILLDKENKKISITNYKPGNVENLKIEIDGSSDQIVLGDVTGNKLTVSTSNEVIAESSTGSKMKLAVGKVGLGGPAGELLEEFEKLLTQMDTLLTQLQAETHQGNLGYPTGPPINTAAYVAIQVQIATIKAVIALLKGGI